MWLSVPIQEMNVPSGEHMQDGQHRETSPANRAASHQADRRRRTTWLGRILALLLTQGPTVSPGFERIPVRHGYTVL